MEAKQTMSIQDLEAIRDHLQAAAAIGARLIPGTYFTGVDMAIRWAERQIDRANGTLKTPVFDKLQAEAKSNPKKPNLALVQQDKI